MTELDITYDPAIDVVTICGVQYSGDMFRQLSFAQPGTWLRITERRDGMLTLTQVPEKIEKTFDVLACLGPPRGVSSV